jgi:hypothetical protein
MVQHRFKGHLQDPAALTGKTWFLYTFPFFFQISLRLNLQLPWAKAARSCEQIQLITST